LVLLAVEVADQVEHASRRHLDSVALADTLDLWVVPDDLQRDRTKTMSRDSDV
jgi:hypothetical protein